MNICRNYRSKLENIDYDLRFIVNLMFTDGNPVTGEGYMKPATGEINTQVPSLNGGGHVINKNRIPPGKILFLRDFYIMKPFTLSGQ